eukprot:SM000009S23582  [mRNA]  locus=s9:877973:879570:- [translate_table: standard]
MAQAAVLGAVCLRATSLVAHSGATLKAALRAASAARLRSAASPAFRRPSFVAPSRPVATAALRPREAPRRQAPARAAAAAAAAADDAVSVADPVAADAVASAAATEDAGDLLEAGAPEAADGVAAEEPAMGGGEAPVAPMKTKALTKQVKHIMNILNKEAVEASLQGREIPDIRPGDVLQLRVEVPENKRRVSLLRGIVISRRNAGINTTFRIRRILAGVGVEMVFPLYSPNIKEIKVVDQRKVRRAKLYYLRDKLARLSTFN